TGPVIGITLVLSAVFVPCAFLSGITGRFFQQFAVTIAASTIISAINALTMTPARALLIFRSREPAQGPEAAAGHMHKREPLPWWIFGVVGGLVLVWQGPHLASILHLPAPIGAEDQIDRPAWLSWAWTVAWFTPGLLAGLVLGWFSIKPVNAALSWLFRGF